MLQIATRFSPGQSVHLKALDFPAIVHEVIVGSGYTLYDCIWWYNGERKAGVLTEAEITEA